MNDITNEIVQFAKNRYESMHLQYLAMTSMVRRQLENTSLVSYDKDLTTLPPNKPFGSYECFDGYHGLEVSRNFVTDLCIHEYNDQKDFLYWFQKGLFGDFLRCDHTRSVAKKVELLTGAMWSYAIMKEHMEIYGKKVSFCNYTESS